MQELLGPGDSSRFFEALEQEPATAVRKNPFKPSHAFDEAEAVPWCPDGRYLAQRPSFIADPLFHAGAYYVQESSSMFLHHALSQLLPRFTAPVKVLDLCAAPGGKSTLISSLLREEDLLVSNEIIRARVNVLEENLLRWGQSNVLISNNDPRDFSALEDYFDVILVDAPCSGEGMFRKDKKAVEEWSGQHVALCAGRQQRIITDVLPALKPGGLLIYSTCTFNEQENEEQVKWLIAEHGFEPVPVAIDPQWPIHDQTKHASPLPVYRFFPHLVKGEGLFMACLQKPQGATAGVKFREHALAFVHRKSLPVLHTWLQQPERYDLIEWNKQVHALPKHLVQDVAILAKYLHLRNAGVRMGELIREALVPDHQLALSNALSQSVRSIAVSREEALKYLKKDALVFAQKQEPGISLLRYEGLGIGWVKVLPNRVNNYLPAHLRILKDI